MLRVSDYNISLPLNNDKKEFIMIHGYSGAFDIVTSELHDLLADSEQNRDVLTNKICDEDLRILEKRGYLTNKTTQEERETLNKVATVFHKAQLKNINITFIPTYNCNFRCSYCFEKSLLDKGKNWLKAVMTRDMVDSVFDQMNLYRTQGKSIGGISLFGGEPLLKPNYEIVKYIVEKCKDNKLPVTAITNGYDLDSFHSLLGNDQINVIQVTLDGSESAHNQRRFLAGGQPSFQKIIANIDDVIKDNNISVIVRSNVNKKNFEEMGQLISLFHEHKWTEHKNFTYYFKSTHSCYEQVEDVVSDVQIMKELSAQYGDIQKYNHNSMYGVLSKMLLSMLSRKSFAPLRAGYCGAVMGMYTVDPFGDIYTCWNLVGNTEERVGVVSTANRKFEMNEKHDYWKSRTTEKIEQCLNCKYSLFCGGGCPAFAKHTTNNIYSAYCDNFQTIFDEVVPDIYRYFSSLPQEKKDALSMVNAAAAK
jgi:uncharacterized protein